jgi:hypothetical protein
VLDAFTRVGASDALVTEARLAMDEFEVMVKEHADDRETFEMMLSGLAESGQGERELAHRKIAFQGNSATWGVQARVRFCTYIVAPSGEPGVGDTAVIGGLVDLRR